MQNRRCAEFFCGILSWNGICMAGRYCVPEGTVAAAAAYGNQKLDCDLWTGKMCIRDSAGAMGVNPATEYETKELENPFYGVYYGQLALHGQPDTCLLYTSRCV